MIDWSKKKTKTQIEEENYLATVPQEIMRWQGVLILKREGYWDTVMSAYNALEPSYQKDEMYAALFETMSWKRSSPSLKSMAQVLGLTDLQLDALYIEASSLEV